MRRDVELLFPLFQRLLHLISKVHEISNSLLQSCEPRRGDREDLAAGRATVVTLLEDPRQVVDREADVEGALDDANACDGRRRISPIAIRVSRGSWQQPAALVETERVSADAGPFG
jgi:hypothetical protein